MVLDAGLALVRECRLDPAAARAVGALDGSETRVVGGVRFFTRPDLPAATLDVATPTDEVRARLGSSLADDQWVGRGGSYFYERNTNRLTNRQIPTLRGHGGTHRRGVRAHRRRTPHRLAARDGAP